MVVSEGGVGVGGSCEKKVRGETGKIGHKKWRQLGDSESGRIDTLRIEMAVS